MVTHRIRFLTLLPCAMLACALLLSACGPATATVEEERVDPRFATAEALVEYYNSITTVPSPDFDSMLEMFYAENELQRNFLEHQRNVVVIGDLKDDVARHFGIPVEPSAARPSGPARITEHTGDRALAPFKDQDGKDETLYLVKVGDRWWISGFTIEHNPGYKELLEGLDDVLMMSRLEVAIEPEMRRRFQNGEFASIDAYRTAFGLAKADYIASHRSDFPPFRDTSEQQLREWFTR